MTQKFVIAALAALLGACASTPDDIRTEGYAAKERRVEVPYPTAARRVLVQARKCWRSTWIGSHVDVDHDIGPDRAELAVVQNTMGGAVTFAVVDMRPAGTGTTILYTQKVLGIPGRAGLESRADYIAAWATGGAECSPW
jgi:hypothetical protein